MQLQQLSSGYTFNVFEAWHSSTAKQRFCSLKAERMDHCQILFCLTDSVKQNGQRLSE
jgi:hypothetical protein